MGLDTVELVMKVENYFSISIPDREAEKAYTIGRLVDCVSKIKEVHKYDFTLRDIAFEIIKETLSKVRGVSSAFTLNDKVGYAFEDMDMEVLAKLEQELALRLPGIRIKPPENAGLLAKTKNWFRYAGYFNFTQTTWKRYIDYMLAYNLEDTVDPAAIKSKYEIYLAIIRITVDQVGVDYAETGLEKSFTDDLGID